MSKPQSSDIRYVLGKSLQIWKGNTLIGVVPMHKLKPEFRDCLEKQTITTK